ncbi:HigA family addiction module antitoxin [Methylobacterium sp. 17Sr1-1]|uniref:HigA family addiction module antitoxin n=1 Tax=Methylobacterium sp. 17Sr1-1 TaxID=2202826 RepID=UPI0024781856|nr:HigA family addiction module antitoxin [Methylobacterium sp. 17Sr1-1]
MLPPLHPGEILREEFMVPLGLTPYAVAKACGVSRTRIERIVREETPVTADTALRLGRTFGVSPQVWINLQGDHDLRRAQRQIGAEIDRIQPLPREAA